MTDKPKTTEQKKKEKEAALLREARKRLDYVETAESDDRNAALEDDRFVAGDQWPENIKSERKNDDRPCLTINKVKQFKNQVVNDIKQNRPRIKVRPVGGMTSGVKVKSMTNAAKDYDLADVFTGLISDIENTSKADQAYDTAVDSAVKGGWGYFRIITKYSDDSGFDQDIVIKRIRNRFSVYMDPDAEEITREDSNYCFISDWIDKDEFTATYKNASMDDLGSTLGEAYSQWYKDDKVRVSEYYRRVPFKKKIARMSNGEVYEVTEESKKIFDELEKAGVTIEDERTVNSYKVEWYKLTGGSVIEGPVEIPCKYIPVIHVSGDEHIIDGKVVREGIIRQSKDPQRMYNYHQTANTEVVALQNKTPYVMGKSQIGDFKKLWEKANKRNLPFLVFDDTKNPNPPQRQTPPIASSGDLVAAQQADMDMQSTMGMYNPSLGAKSNETSGKAIIAKQREADTGTFHYYDNLTFALEYAGRILISMIQKVYDSNRVIRLRFPDNTEDFVEINKTIIDEQTGQEVTIHDMSMGRFDVVVDTGPSYTTQRIEAADGMMQFISAMPQAGAVISDLVAKAMDWPDADEVQERLRKTLPPGIVEYAEGEEPPQAPPTPEQQAEMAKAEAAMKKADADIEMARAKQLEAQAKIAEITQGGQQGQVTPQQIVEIIDDRFAQNMAEFIQQMQQAQ